MSANRFFRNTAFGSIAGCIATLCSFLSSLIVARQLGLEMTGRVTFAFWIASTVSSIVALGVPFTLSRFLPEVAARGEGKTAIAFASYLLHRFLIVALMPAAVGVAYGGWRWLAYPPATDTAPQGTLDDPLTILLIGTLGSIFAIAEFAKCFSRGSHQFDQLALASTASAIGQIFVLASTTLFFGASGALLGYAAGALLFVPLLRPLVGIQAAAAGQSLVRFRRYMLYRWGAELLSLFVWSRVEVLFLQNYHGPKPVALFVIGLTLANVAIQAPMMLTWGLMPHFAERIALADHASTQRTYALATRLLALLVLPACFCVAATVDQLIPLLFGQAFAPACRAAQILVIAAAYPAIASIGSSVLLSTDRSDVDFYACLVGTVMSVAGGLLLIRSYGLEGAVWSRICVQLVVIFITTVFILKRLKLKLPVASLCKLTTAAAVSALASRGVLELVRGPIPLGLGLAVLTAAAVYLGFLKSLKIFEPDEEKTLRFCAQRFLKPMPYLAAVVPRKWREA